MKISFWSFVVSPWAIFTGTLFLALVLWFSIRLLRRQRATRGLVWVECLRWLTAAALVFTLFRPELVRQVRQKEQPLVAVLCDGSGSMSTRDVRSPALGDMTREAWVRTQCVARFWAPLEGRYKVAVEDFAAAPAAGSPTNAPVQDPGTDINLALEQALQKHPTLRALILLSDGDWNAGKSPVSAATRLSLREAPVFAVTTGSDRFLPDLELRSVSAPAYALLDEHLSLPFTIQSRLPRDVRVTMTLEGPGGRVAEREVVIPAMAPCQQSIELVPKRAGDFDFTLKLPVQKDEVFADNNEKTFRISLRSELLKVLVVDSVPRWEFRFLRNAFSRDPGVEAHTLLLHPEMAVGGGRNYLSAFPSREDLMRYDVVFLGDVGIGAGELTSEQAEWLKGLVEQQGSGLVFLPGIRGRQMTLLTTALAELVPVDLDKSSAAVVPTKMESHLALTQQGRDHLLTMLASTPAENEMLWKALPGFWWNAPVLKAKPGTDVLAVHAETRNQHGRLPLLVTRSFGNGKALFLGTDSAWRWRKGVEDTYHYRFWGQVVRWMAHQRHLAHQEGIRFFFNPETPQRGDRVFLHATVFDKSGFPVHGGKVRAVITAESGAGERIELNPEPGGWGVFTGSFMAREGGRHKISIIGEEAERQVSAEMVVQSPRRELAGRPARTDVMREIAGISGGRCGGIEDLPEMIRSIELLPQARPVEERLRVWCHPLWAALVILMLGLYWIGRKFAGMI